MASASLSKASAGQCEWHETQVYVEQRDRVATVHETAIAQLEVLMELAEEGGLPERDYKAPVGRRAGSRSKRPWIGELKSDGPEDRRGHRRMYRLYFAEAPDPDPALLAAFLGHKDSDWNLVKQRSRQTQHISTAMDTTVRWCKSKVCKFRVLGS